MFKKSFVRKICIASFCLLLLFILYLFPKNRNDTKTLVPKSSYTVTNSLDTIYLLDNKDYVARVNVALTSSTPSEKALEIISYLTESSDTSSLIPNGFKTVIPASTKVLSSDLKDGNFKVNFSHEFMNVTKEREVDLIESLVYSLTSIKEIKSITILVDGKILNKLPHSLEFLPNPLDRSYGINKKYDLNNLKGSTKTTMYYVSKCDDLYYYVPVTKISNSQDEKIEIIIKELTSSPIYETNLMSYLNSEAAILDYEFIDKNLNIEFNNDIFSNITKNSLLEEVTYAINLSIKDNYDVESVSYNVDNKKIATFDLKNLE